MHRNLTLSHFQMIVANSQWRNRWDEVFASRKQRTQTDTKVQPRSLRFSSVGSLDNIKRQKTNECDGGMQERQITASQSSLARGGLMNKCASLEVRTPSGACFQIFLSGKGETGKVIFKYICKSAKRIK